MAVSSRSIGRYRNVQRDITKRPGSLPACAQRKRSCATPGRRQNISTGNEALLKPASMFAIFRRGVLSHQIMKPKRMRGRFQQSEPHPLVGTIGSVRPSIIIVL